MLIYYSSEKQRDLRFSGVFLLKVFYITITLLKRVVHFKKKKKTFADNLLTSMSSKLSLSMLSMFLMKTFQDFYPYNALYRAPNGSRSKRQFQCKLQTVQRAIKEHFTHFNINLPNMNYRKWTTLRTMGDRAFSSAAPQLWNSLPVHLRAPQPVDHFKKGLKTFLFRKSYF